MQIVAATQPLFSGRTMRRCVALARDYLLPPYRLHRWCAAGVMGMVMLLLACFVMYAYVEKYHLTGSVFYGRLEYSFVDGGYPEMFGYALEVTACMLFVLFAMAYGKRHWFAWAAILFVTFVDDAFKLHENIGHVFVIAMHLEPAIGDLIGFAVTGLLPVVFWIAGVRTISGEEDLSAYLVFTVYFALLILFGVGVDAIHALVGKNASQTLFTLFEDGGELVMTAIITLSVFGMCLRQKSAVSDAAVSIDSALPRP